VAISRICHQDSRYADCEPLIYYGFSSNSFPVFFLFGLGLRQFIWGPTLSVSQNQVILRWLHTISRWLHEFYFVLMVYIYFEYATINSGLVLLTSCPRPGELFNASSSCTDL
jgi:hypothetical protein